jgi:hypothetical protein
MMRTFARASLLPLTLAALACGGSDLPGPIDEETAADEEAITGGSLVSNFVPLSSAVKIEFINQFGSTTCSGQKVNSLTFWTAGHCTDNVKVGDTVKITNSTNGTFSGSSSYTRTVGTVATHPTLTNAYAMLPFGLYPEHYDVGRFTLTETTPNIPSYSTHESAWIGPDSLLILAGYGCDEADSTHSGKKQWASFILEDHTEAAAIGKGIDYYVHNMIDISDTQQGCAGDSGGPAWTFDGTTYKTAGIAVHGGEGSTGFVRYGNVRNWLVSPTHNVFVADYRGFVFNHYTGRCITSSGSSAHSESNCDTRDQNSSIQSWRLADSGLSGSFYLVNGSSGKCLDLETTSSGSKLVSRTCLPTTQTNNTQRWKFDTIGVTPAQPEYRYFVNTSTGRCTEVSSPSSTSSYLVSKTCSTADPTWRYQAWVMTR